jgi:cyclase
MLNKRLIPSLIIKNGSVVKGKNFKNHVFVGDPVNSARIFNEVEVDELILLDISATSSSLIDYRCIENLANECFMPLTYGGGVNSLPIAGRLFSIGIEKISINSATYSNLELIKQISQKYGSQAVISSVDFKQKTNGSIGVYSNSGTVQRKVKLLDWLSSIEDFGAGEILLTDIGREGTYSGLNFQLFNQLSNHLTIPLIASGGTCCISNANTILVKTNVSGVCLSSVVTFYKQDQGVLIHWPEASRSRTFCKQLIQ